MKLKLLFPGGENKMKNRIFAFLAIATVASAFAATPQASGYHLSNKFAVGGEARWDYITIDSANRRLYVTHGTKVEVLDADSGKVTGEVPGTAGVHGVALAPELGKGFTSNGNTNTVSVFDLQTLAHTAEIKVGKKPDAIIYDSGLGRIFVANGDGDDLTAIDAKSDKVLGTIPLGGGPEYMASDEKGTLWVNIEEKDAFVTVNAKTLTVTATTPLPGCKGPSAMAIDRANRTLFIGCANRTLVVVDPDKGAVTATLPIGEHVDATAFDPESGLAFAATGDGHVTVVNKDSADKYRVLDTVDTLRGAKTMALDSKTKKLFLPTVENVPPTATGPPRPSGTGAYKPGPFVIVVLEK
jgi:YVTN family beta-propeller protein